MTTTTEKIKPNYTEGVECIAFNDEPSEMEEEFVFGYASVMVLSAAFGVSQEKVAADVVRVRRREMARGNL